MDLIDSRGKIYRLKKVERNMDCVNGKLSTLENARIGPSVLYPPLPTSIHMQDLGGIDFEDFFSQVQMLIIERNMDWYKKIYRSTD